MPLKQKLLTWKGNYRLRSLKMRIICLLQHPKWKNLNLIRKKPSNRWIRQLPKQMQLSQPQMQLTPMPQQHKQQLRQHSRKQMQRKPWQMLLIKQCRQPRAILMKQNRTWRMLPIVSGLQRQT